MGQKFGQHFLSDRTVLAKIADTVLGLQQELGCTQLIEIGPGQGALTELIIDQFGTVTLMEIDETMKGYLEPIIQDHTDAELVRGDVLKVPLPSPAFAGVTGEGGRLGLENTLVVGNLPYYITSPIFRTFFVPSPLTPPTPLYPGGVFLIQKEVAEKIKTITKQKSYLRWLLNYAYDIEFNFIVPATAFDPPPKVQSAVVSLKLKSESEKLKIDFDRMIEFLDIVSMYSRKTLRKIWKMREEDLSSFILPDELEGKRVQELGWEEMSHILKK